MEIVYLKKRENFYFKKSIKPGFKSVLPLYYSEFATLFCLASAEKEQQIRNYVVDTQSYIQVLPFYFNLPNNHAANHIFLLALPLQGKSPVPISQQQQQD